MALQRITSLIDDDGGGGGGGELSLVFGDHLSGCFEQVQRMWDLTAQLDNVV